MKANFFAVLVIFVSFSFFGCTSGPKSIKFNELSSKEFTLNSVMYMTNMEELTKDVPMVFLLLPIREVVKQTELKYGINIDMGVFENLEIPVSQIKSYNLLMPNYFIECETDASQRVSIVFGKYQQEKELKAYIALSVYEDHKLVSRNEFSISLL